ncbi:hypothetical protein [Acidimangrovimonas sediminis]|uniref:hypothetical protein n=1 Tax=Acidimangrovimonas sediminis TaxID=2056283 RepID=UPI0011AEC48C|nr:hypothetical protein [Acidimangrovimonas sediminis]
MSDAVTAPLTMAEAERLAAEVSAAGGRLALVYSQDKLLEAACAGRLDFLSTLSGLLERNGYRLAPVDGLTAVAPVAPRPGLLNIWMIERPPVPATRPDLVHCFPGYLNGFWFFDPLGVRNNSSVRLRDFRPHKMAEEFSAKFMARLRQRFVATGRTKFAQAPAGEVEIPDGCITIAAQTFAAPEHYPSYAAYPDLIAETLRQRGDRPVVIKPHPWSGLRETEVMARYHDPRNGVIVATPNLHEVLAKSAVVVTRCSAVAIEAMLHRVPAVVSAQVDFHHAVTTLYRADAIGAAMQAAEAARTPFAKYLTWYFGQNLLPAAQPAECEARIAEVLALMGLPVDAAAEAGFRLGGGQ